MTRPHAPQPGELPTLHQLNRATLGAFVAAGVILVTTVLPAEYGVDPTGIGGLLGLTPMGEMKQAEDGVVSGSPEPVAVAPADATSTPAATPEEVSITLAPNQGREIKALMREGMEIKYSWKTDGPAILYEFHGEPTGAVGNEYTSYKKATSAGESGTFRAGFTGTHGWYWKNRTSQPVTVTARITGTYESFAALP